MTQNNALKAALTILGAAVGTRVLQNIVGDKGIVGLLTAAAGIIGGAIGGKAFADTVMPDENKNSVS